jgi:uncharacterized protein with HEPN domain
LLEAAEQAHALVSGVDLDTLTSNRQRRDALLWNFTVLGEAAAQLDVAVKERFPEIKWAQPARLRNRIVHGYWSIDVEILQNHRQRPAPGVRSTAPQGSRNPRGRAGAARLRERLRSRRLRPCGPGSGIRSGP